MAWLIRPAEDGDAPSVADLMNAVIRDTAITFNSEPRTVTEVAQWPRSGFPVLVLEEQGAVAGFLRMMPFRAGPGYARCVEHTIFLTPGLRGQGAGRALLAEAATRAAALGKTHMIACISAENPAGAAFHAAMGFAKVGHLPGVGYKFGREMDLLLYQKRI